MKLCKKFLYFSCRYLARLFISCMKSFIYSARLARYVQNLLQDVANPARKILPRLAYILQDGFYLVILGQHIAIMGQYSTTRPRQMCIDSGSHIRSPKPKWSRPLVPFHQSWIYISAKSTLEKKTSRH